MRPERAEKFFWKLFILSWLIAFAMIVILSGCIDPTPQVTATPTWNPYPGPSIPEITPTTRPYPNVESGADWLLDPTNPMGLTSPWTINPVNPNYKSSINFMNPYR